MNNPKAAATTATGSAAALTTIVCWILNSNGVEVPGEVQGALTVLLVSLGALLFVPGKDGRHEA